MQHFRVGEFVVRPDLNEIEGPRGTRHVEPKVMEVLVCLASRPGQVMSRDVLMDAVWPDVNVGEKVLTRAVSELRRAFRDDPRSPAVIETITKRGYRLMVQVRPESGEGLPDPATRTKTAQQALPAWVALALLGLALVLLATVPWLRPAPAAEALRWAESPRPVSALPGLESQSVLSPDGHLVAYMAQASPDLDARLHLWDSRSQTSAQVTQGPGFDMSPLFTPDGGALVFLRYTSGKCRIMRVRLGSGEEELVRSCPSGLQSGLAWAPGGKDLIGVSGLGCGSASRLVRIPLNGADPEPVTDPPQGWLGDSQPLVLKDGSLLFRRAQELFSQDLWIKPLEGPERRFSRLSATILGHTVAQDGSVLVSTESDGPGYQIRRLSPEGQDLGPVRLPGWNLKYPKITAQGHLLYEQWDYDTNLWSIPLQQKEAEPTQVAPSTYWDWHGVYSPDGGQIAYVSNRTGSFQLWTATAGGQDARPLTRLDAASAARPAWSPNGRRLVFEARRDGESDLYSVPSRGGPPRRLTSDSGDERWPAFSADGRWIYFATSRTGRSEIWKLPSQGGPARQVTTDGGQRALASRDGRWLFFSNDEGIFRQPVGGGKARKVAQIPQWALHGGWTLTPHSIYVFRSDPKNQSVVLFQAPLEPTAPADGGQDAPWQQVASLKRLFFGPAQAISISPDDASLLLVRVDRAESNIQLLPAAP